MTTTDHLKAIDEFEARYRYDSTFMRELLEHSPEGYAKFANFMPFATHREKLSPDTYWLARLAAMQAEDCGHCLQLNVRMALEAGVARELVEAAVRRPGDLPAELQDVHAYARHVAANTPPPAGMEARLQARFGTGELLELGICIATARVFPAIKRTLGYSRSCRLLEIEV